jgi:uncharacterized protein YmfQ (DUF2313 family)
MNMTQRIIELAEQAGYDMDVQQHQKFAELIVQECVQVCLSQRDPANLNYKPSERFAEAVKQHFGVDK